MVARIQRTADFERVLAVAPCSRSAHFAAHHLAARPEATGKARRRPLEPELSTTGSPGCPPPVDDLSDPGPGGCWLGTVVPKRHARRSVTRNLLKRQMRAALQAHCGRLPPGLWVLRLRAGFDAGRFSSPGSALLRRCARDELALLLQRAAMRD